MTEHVRSQSLSIDPGNKAFAHAFAGFLAGGALDALSLERAKRVAEAAGDRFDQVLTKLGIMSDGDLAASLAQFLDMPLYGPDEAPDVRLLPDKLPSSFVTQNRIVPLRIEGDTLVLAVVDPLDQVPMESVRFVVDHALRFEIIAPAEFERLVATLYAEDTRPDGGKQTVVEIDPSEHDLQRLRDSASEAPVIRLVNSIIAGAVDAGASDIYVEPAVNSLLVRYRVDGLLRLAHEIPARQRAAVISRIKILARLDIAERRLPQDGRIKLPFRGNDIDFRIATIPTIDGETVTIRVLDRSRVDLDFPSLGFSTGQIGSLQRLMQHPNGIILVTGPTGSGKTTTLYTMLKHVNRPTAKIFTVEDPIEYQLAGISQVQVQEGIDLDFPACLRSILRHHPDMIMIGEIRDAETARIAVQASLTGHLVFSTVHTISAAETVTRLTDMGIEPFMLGSTLRGIMAQRLVRRLCPACATPGDSADAWARHLLEKVPALREAGPPALLEARGCRACQGTGFQGQMSIAEIVHVDEEVREAIRQRRSGSDIQAMARRTGAVTIYEDGVGKAWRGLTTVEEVIRVTNAI